MPDYSSDSSKKKTEGGVKARQRDDKEDRSLLYRDWRRETVKKGEKKRTCYTSDIDQVEYMIVKGETIPVAILELTRYDFDESDRPSQSWAKYLSSILDRYFFRDNQGRFVKTIAGKLGIPAYIILFRHDLAKFWVFDMCDAKALWVHKDQDEYRDWLAHLKVKALEKHTNNETQQ